MTTTTAFFDLDYTLLNTSSGVLYLKEAIKQRRVPVWVVGLTTIQYQLRRLDFGQAHGRLIKHVGQHGQREAAQFFAEWLPRTLFPRVTPAARAKIAWHQQQGHRVVILSASIAEIVQPVAEYLGLGPDYLCTRLRVDNDRYTGELDGPLCYGPGKVYWAKQWLNQNQADFQHSYFYTDSSSDLPLLELVGHPMPVNPSRKLAKIAAAKGWPIERFY